MSNEELLQKLEQRFITEREETRKIVQQEASKIMKEETRKIVQEETKKIVQQETRKIVQEEISKEIEPIKKYLKRLDKRSLQTNKTLHLIAKLYNQEDVNLKKRVSNIEEYLGIPNPTALM